MTATDAAAGGALVTRQTGASGVFVDVVASLDDLYFQSRLAAPDNFEPAVSVALLTLPKDGVALDLGACLGVVSAAFAQLAPSGKVIAVEASSAMQPGLTQTCAAVAHSNITVVNAAMGEVVGTGSYHAHPQGGAWGYVDESGGYPVHQTTVDALVVEHKLDRVDLVKVDTEGSELAVLRGAEQTIRTFRPVLTVELNPFCLWRFGRTLPQDLVEWIRQRYPLLWAIDGDAVATPINNEHDVDAMLNVLGARGGLVDLVASATPIDFPAKLWTSHVDTEAAASPRSFRSRLRTKFRS